MKALLASALLGAAIPIASSITLEHRVACLEAQMKIQQSMLAQFAQESATQARMLREFIDVQDKFDTLVHDRLNP